MSVQSVSVISVMVFSRPHTNGPAIGTVLHLSVAVCNVKYCG